VQGKSRFHYTESCVCSCVSRQSVLCPTAFWHTSLLLLFWTAPHWPWLWREQGAGDQLAAVFVTSSAVREKLFVPHKQRTKSA